jgi:hypothetical protein
MYHSPIHFLPFASPKCVAPIATADPLVRSALVWASLEGTITAINAETITRSEPSPSSECILLEISDDVLVLDVVRGASHPETRRRDEAAWRAFGWTPLTLLPGEIEREARFVNAARIWRERTTPVPNTMRFQIMDRLREDGPLRVHELLTGLRAERDPLPVLFSLACGDELAIDLDDALGRDSIVRIR